LMLKDVIFVAEMSYSEVIHVYLLIWLMCLCESW
jgi:hypothetical protein